MKRKPRRPLQLRLCFQLELPLEHAFTSAQLSGQPLTLVVDERDGRAHASIEAALEEAIERAAREGTR